MRLSSTYLSARRLEPSGFAFSSRRRGSVLTLLAGTLPIIFLSCGLVIDLGILQIVRAQAQRAADAAALAGAWATDGGPNSKVIEEGERYAKLNARNIASESSNYWSQIVISPNEGGNRYKVRATVRRDVQVYFAPVFEAFMQALNPSEPNPIYSRQVAATAVAEKFVQADLSTGAYYGIADPTKSPANQAIFGRYAEYQWGDPYATQYLQDGSLNPRWQELQDKGPNYDGYSYTIDASNFRNPDGDGKLQIQIFDPEAFSPGGTNSWDEMRAVNGAIAGLAAYGEESKATQTKFTVWDTKGTADYNDDELITQKIYDSTNSEDTNEKWVKPDGFDVSMSALSSPKLRLQVQTLDGGSENGFKLRAGPTSGLTMDDVAWNNAFGDKGNTDIKNIAVPITADGTIQMNFTQTNPIEFQLGNVDAKMAGKQIQVSKFDVDVGSEYIRYYTKDSSGNPVLLKEGEFPDQRNATWSTDTITMPDDFKGGMVFAGYSAGAGDTSNWSLSGGSKGSGNVRLTQ